MLTEKPITKLYFSIGEVAKHFNVAPSLIRFWEGEFGLVIHKSGGGTRRYTQSDMSRIERIYFLLRKERYTIKGAKQKLAI